MEWISFKTWLVTSTGLERDALHIYGGLLGLFVAAILSRRTIGSLVPLLIVLCLEMANEVSDMLSDGPIEQWELDGARHDIWNTMLAPVMLFVLARLAPGLFARGKRNRALTRAMPTMVRRVSPAICGPMQPDLTAEPLEARRVVLFGTNAGSLINFRAPLIRTMVERGHEVFAIAAHMDDATASTLRSLGAEPLSVNLDRTSFNPLAALRSAAELRKLFERIRPEVVIAYTIKPITLGAPAARATGVPRFVPLVTGLGYAFTGGWEPKRLLSRAAATLLYIRAFRASSIAVFQNKDDLSDFRRLRVLPAGVETAVIDGSGVDLDHFCEVPPPPDVSFLMIARLLKDKGVREFGEAARRLKREHPDARVSLVGFLDGSPDSVSEAELREIQAGGVAYLGGMSDVRLPLADHSIYVLPSYREGTPRSVLEAMATGRAIITTDAPGCRETVVDGENGLLVAPRDGNSLFDAMLRLAREPQRIAPMGRVSRRLAEERYDVHKVNAALLRHAGL